MTQPTRKPDRPDPTRQVLGGSENIRVGGGSYFRVIFGFGSVSGRRRVIYIFQSEPDFFFLKKLNSNKVLSSPPSATSQVSISQNITAHHQCRPQTTHHSHHPRTVETKRNCDLPSTSTHIFISNKPKPTK